MLQGRQRETGWASEGNGHAGLSCSAHYIWGLWIICENNVCKLLSWLKLTRFLLFCYLQLCLKDVSFLRRWVCSQIDIMDLIIRSDLIMLLIMFPCNQRVTLLLRWKWKVLVVDEAHRLKNQNSLLHKTLTQVRSFTWFELWHNSFLIFLTIRIVFNFPPYFICVVLSWLQSPADRNPHPEQPAGALLPAELHSAQHLHTWWRGQLPKHLLQCAESTSSWYDESLFY